MRSLFLTVAVVAPVLLGASPGFADPADPNDVSSTTTHAMTTPSAANTSFPPGPITSDGDPNERICKISGSPTGTRLGAQRICMTRQQWNDEEKELLRVRLTAPHSSTQTTTVAPH